MFALSWPPWLCVLSLRVEASSVNFRRERSVLTCMTEALVEKRGSVEGYPEEVILLIRCMYKLGSHTWWLLHRWGTSWEDDVREDGCLNTTRPAPSMEQSEHFMWPHAARHQGGWPSHPEQTPFQTAGFSSPAGLRTQRATHRALPQGRAACSLLAVLSINPARCSVDNRLPLPQMFGEVPHCE